MASRELDLLLKLYVEGTPQAEALRKSIEQIRDAFKKLEGLKSLDNLLKADNIVRETDNIFQAFSKLKRQIQEFGRIKFLDLDLSKAEKIKAISHEIIDLTKLIGKTPIDLKTDKARAQMDLLASAARQTAASMREFNSIRVDVDTKFGRPFEKTLRILREVPPALNRVNRELSAHDDAIRRATASQGHFFRSALFLRRAIIGLGIGFAARETLELVQAFDRAKQSIEAVFGATNVGAEFKFIQEQAERLGINVADLAKEYAKFSAAARALGIDQAVVRDNFLAVAEAGAKLGLSSDEVVGALTAIQQIASKGRLSMEELRQQLGDRIPGAVSIAAKALGVTEARLFALVEAGQVSSDVFLNKFPAALRASFGTDQSTRIETTAAAVQRFQNALQELIDTAVRAGALEAFTTVLKELGKFFKEPSTVEGFKVLSQAILSFTKSILSNIPTVLTLISVLGTFGILGKVIPVVSGFYKGLVVLKSVLFPVATAAVTAGTAIAGTGAAAGAAAVKTGVFLTAIRALALALVNPFVLAIAGLTAVNVALVNKYVEGLEKARAAAEKLSATQIAIGLADKSAEIFRKQAADMDKLTNASETLALSRKEINGLSADTLRIYNEQAAAAKELSDVETEAVEQQITGLKLRIQLFNDSTVKTNEAIFKNQEYKDSLENAQEALAAIKARATDFATSLENIQKRANESGVALSAYNLKLQQTADDLIKAYNQGENLNAKFKQINKLSLADLGGEVQLLVNGFENAIKAGKGVEEAFKTLIPKDFANVSVSAMTAFGDSLAYLEQQGELSAKQIRENLLPALEKLSGADLNRFAIQAQAAFEVTGMSARGLSLVLDGQLRTALKNMGLDFEDAGAKVKKSFTELTDNLQAVASNALATGQQVRAAFDVSIEAAKTKEELELLRGTIEGLGLASGKFSDVLTDSLLRLDDKIRLSATTINSALGDSFTRLGIQAKSQLKAISDQAKIDFDRVVQSGQATALEVEEAWRKMAEAVIKANNGIPPIEIKIKAVDFNAFDLIVKAAETAGDRVRKAIESAIPMAETRAQLEALSAAITSSFEKGKLAVDDFGRLITEVGFKMRELVSKPVGELAASAELLGLKTKDQLKAIADNAKEAFDNIRTSGQFTTQELVKGAQQYLDAYMAANNGVVDSFDPAIAKALEIVNSVNDMTGALTELKDKAKSLMSDPISTGSLADKSLQELQQMLIDTSKAYRAIGIQNVQDLQIIQQIQKFINQKGAENSDLLRQKLDESTKAMEQLNFIVPGGGGKGSAPVGGGGVLPGGGSAPITNNFNFNGTALTPDTVKREVMPVISRTMVRRR